MEVSSLRIHKQRILRDVLLEGSRVFSLHSRQRVRIVESVIVQETWFIGIFPVGVGMQDDVVVELIAVGERGPLVIRIGMIGIEGDIIVARRPILLGGTSNPIVVKDVVDELVIRVDGGIFLVQNDGGLGNFVNDVVIHPVVT